MLLRTLSTAACCLVLTATSYAQMQAAQPVLSEPAVANVALAGGTVTINYSTPHMRGRKIMGELVPYNQVWRTGANPATSLYTPVPLHIGSTLVPAGKYTIYTLPAPGKWMLIINKQTGQWGTEYHQEQDLARIPMKEKTISPAQEIMSISFEGTKDSQTELHVRWETTDVSVKVTTP